MTAKLTDLQLVLLSAAAARPDGSLLPPPESVGDQHARITKVIGQLLKRSLIEEVDVTSAEQAWRKQDERRIGVIITNAGRSAIGVEPGLTPMMDEVAPLVPSSSTPTETGTPHHTKSAHVLELLRCADGATLAELVAATGWLPHTTRAALTGLRKKGHAIVRDKRDDVSCYRISEVA